MEYRGALRPQTRGKEPDCFMVIIPRPTRSIPGQVALYGTLTIAVKAGRHLTSAEAVKSTPSTWIQKIVSRSTRRWTPSFFLFQTRGWVFGDRLTVAIRLKGSPAIMLGSISLFPAERIECF